MNILQLCTGQISEFYQICLKDKYSDFHSECFPSLRKSMFVMKWRFFLESWGSGAIAFANWFWISLNNKANLKNILYLMEVLKHGLLVESKWKEFLTHPLKKQIFLYCSRVIIINHNFKILNYEKYLILGSSCEFIPLN